MVSLGEARVGTRNSPTQMRWQGRSGRAYALMAESLDHFSLSDDSLYLIARGGHALWVGSAGDLVSDPVSRDRFRLAMTCADRIFSVISTTDSAQRLSTIWDLEGAAPQIERDAA